VQACFKLSILHASTHCWGNSDLIGSGIAPVPAWLGSRDARDAVCNCFMLRGLAAGHWGWETQAHIWSRQWKKRWPRWWAVDTF